MINLMLVDDDALFRAQFRGMIDWERAGFPIVAEARNGREAIREIERRKPDVILTDISMPVMDGIGLIEYVGQYHPEIPVIALSAYDDFNFVRSSLKKGAQDYLLKSKMDGEALLTALKALAGRVGGSVAERQGDRREIEEFYFLLLAGWFASPTAMHARASKLGVALPLQGVFPIVARMDRAEGRPGEDGAVALSDAVLGMMQEILGRAAFEMVRIAPDRVLILYPASGSGWPAAPYREALLLIVDNIRRFFSESISFGVGDLCVALPDLPAAYGNACARYDAARFLGKRAFIAQADSSAEPKMSRALSARESQEIASLVQGGDGALLTEALTSLFGRLESEGCSASDLTFVYAELIHILLRASREYALEARSDDIPSLDSFQRIEDLRDWFTARFLAVNSAVRACFGRNFSEYTRAAILYMRKNYANKISLRDVAAELNLNACYLSRLFKEDTGENLICWLNAMRMDEAERLLRLRELTIRQIADRVGIGNYNHFFTMFRESRGITPTEFRKKLHD